MNVPYTHQAHARACFEAARAGVVLDRKCVQVRRGQLIYCAQIVEAVTLDKAGDCWTVEATWPHIGRMTVLVRNVRDCEGAEGNCVCAEEKAPARSVSEDGRFLFSASREARVFSQAGVVAPPESLTHETASISERV
ncbi:MAG: hypothetical protein EPO09_07175 [Aquabacterium sp.]|uniref:hypothetical protein n=1 Tax=Aquabacterium sp. TaxID=1872578 RepID=UPI0012047F12|nr:hypothetical protein [Aquabacterium sp.]TAK95906.1 MAG: hypothetical protein EPO09_07175 [Aquabacterium sp.]